MTNNTKKAYLVHVRDVYGTDIDEQFYLYKSLRTAKVKFNQLKERFYAEVISEDDRTEYENETSFVSYTTGRYVEDNYLLEMLTLEIL